MAGEEGGASGVISADGGCRARISLKTSIVYAAIGKVLPEPSFDIWCTFDAFDVFASCP